MSLLFAVLIGYLGIIGSVKLMSGLCLLTPVVNTMMMFSAAQGYTEGFTEILSVAPAAWYVLAFSIICAVVGIVLLANGSARYFGKRRLELRKEYADLVKEYAFIRENEKSSSGVRPAADVLIEEDPAEIEGQLLTLRAHSIPNAISKVSKKSVFYLHRELVCKKYKCIDYAVNDETYILTFAGNKKALIKWVPDEKSIYVESSTKYLDEEFHELMLDVIKYLGKNMGSKFEVADNFAANR